MHQLVPQASLVAGLAHHLAPEACAPSADSTAAPSALACPQTGAPCPALAALFSTFAPVNPDARSWMQKLAPCSECRVSFECGRDALRHVRLGQRERDVLVGVSSGGVLTLTEPGMSRSLSAARRRAALSLVKAGLVVSAVAPAPARDVSKNGSKGAPLMQRAAVSLTPLGHYVLAAYGRFITSGKPVRWTRPSRRVSLPGQDPALLSELVLSRTASALRDTLDDLKRVLVAAIGGQMKDPGQLDSITRHLEQKATLLRAVLEPIAEPTAGYSSTLANTPAKPVRG